MIYLLKIELFQALHCKDNSILVVCLNTSKWKDTYNVVYWPPTRPSSQKKKCTSVNTRSIRSKISGDQGWPWLSRGWIECEIVTLAGSRWTSNYYITPATWSSDQLERRCWNENHVPGPQLSSPEEWERKAVIASEVGGVSMLQFCSVSNSLSHTTLSIKWEVYFSKELCPLVVVLTMFPCIVTYVLCSYTTIICKWIVFT